MSILRDLVNGVTGAVGGLPGAALQVGVNAIDRSIANRQSMANWREQFNATNAYNLPVNQLRNWASAGINPAVALQSSTSLQSSSSHAAPTGGMGATPIAAASNMELAAQAALARQQAFGQKIENKSLQQVKDANIRKTLAEADYYDTQSDLAEIDKLTRGARNDAEINKLVVDVKKSIAEASSAVSQGRLFDQQAFTEQVRELLMRAQARLSQAEFDALQVKLKHLDEYYQAVNEELRAKSASERGSAAESYALAADSRTFRQARLQVYKSEAALNQDQAKKIAPEIELLQKENNIYYWRFAADCIRLVEEGIMDVMMFKRIFGAAGKAGKALKGAKNSKEAAKAVGDIFEHEAKPTDGGLNWEKLKQMYPDYKTRFPTLTGLYE